MRETLAASPKSEIAILKVAQSCFTILYRSVMVSHVQFFNASQEPFRKYALTGCIFCQLQKAHHGVKLS